MRRYSPSAWRSRSGWCAAILCLVGCAGCGMPLATVAAQRPLAQAQVNNADPITYVAIGASDSFGIGTQDPKTQNWPLVLARQLGTPVHLVNLGIPGATADLAARDELPVALDAHPALVTVFLGVNDYDQDVPLATFTRQLQTLLAALRQATSARIYVGNIPDLTALPRYAHSDLAALRLTIQQWNEAIATLCATENVTLVDIFAGNDLTAHPEYIAADGFHPSTAGAKRLAAIYAAAVLANGPLGEAA